MKKALLLIGAVLTLVFGMALTASANDYTLPSVAVPPTVDGVFSEKEWVGSRHTFMSSTEGVVYSSQDIDLGDATYDVYMCWFYDGSEERSGFYFCIRAKDDTSGSGYTESYIQNRPLGYYETATDRIVITLDAEYRHDDTNTGALMFALYPHSNEDRKGPGICKEYCRIGIATGKYATYAVTESDTGYVMELFVPYSTISIVAKDAHHTKGETVGIGIGVMDYTDGSPNYLACDFGTKETDLFTAVNKTRFYNTVTLGDIEKFPPDFVPLDRTEFVGLLQRADRVLMNSGDYTEESVEALSLAVNATQNYVYYVQKETLDEYTALLRTALNGLVKKGYPETRSLLASAAALNAADYTPASWQALQTTVASASALTNENTKEEFRAAAKTLTSALEQLVLAANGEHRVETAALESALSEFDLLQRNRNFYTEATWAAYEQAVQTARGLNKTSNVQSEYDAALASLQQAHANLKRLSASALTDQDRQDTGMDAVLVVYIALIGCAVAVTALFVILRVVKKKKNKAE